MNPFIRDMHIEKWLSYKAMQMGRECGEFCDHWLDPERMQSITDAHMQHEYQDACFMPSLIISAADCKVRVEIKCSSCSYLRFHHTSCTRPELFCKKQFPTLEKLLEQEFNKFLRKENGPRSCITPESPEAD